MRVRSQNRKAVAALFGATPLGIAGALLQWLTLAILVAIGLPDLPLSVRLVIAPLGAMMLLAGVVLALRGGSLGPLIVIPGIIGVAMVVLLTIVFYPFRWFMASDDHAKPYATKAVNAILGFGFRQLGLHRISGASDVRNEAVILLGGIGF